MLHITRTKQLSPAVAREFTEIYEGSFPPSERQDVEVLLAMVAGGLCACYLALEGDSVVGLALLPDLGEAEIWYLNYMAVAPAVRGRGVGGHLLDHLGRDASSAGSGSIVFSVEDPEEVQGEERSIRLRRISFYRRHGASRAECAPRFRVPRFDGPGTQPFQLMWLPVRSGAPRLEGPLLRRTVHAILTKLCELPPTDPLLSEVLADLVC